MKDKKVFKNNVSFDALFKKIGKKNKKYLQTFRINKNKTEKENSNLIIESKIQSKVENIELRRSRRRLPQYIPRRVIFAESKVAKEASYVKLLINNQAILSSKYMDKV